MQFVYNYARRQGATSEKLYTTGNIFIVHCALYLATCDLKMYIIMHNWIFAVEKHHHAISFRSKLQAKMLVLAYSANQYHKLSPGVTVTGPITGLGRCEERATIVML